MAVIIVICMKLEKIVELFPIPLMVYELGRALTKSEITFINSYGTADKRGKNIGNTYSKDSHVLDHVELKQLHTDLTGILVDAFERMYSPTSPCAPYITQSWLNFTDRGQYHHEHIHPNSILSAVLYLRTANGDRIVFTKPAADLNILLIEPRAIDNLTAGSWCQEVKDNTVVVFPSKLPHHVPPVEYEGGRISLSLNTFVRGEVGARGDFNHLVL